MNPPNKSVSFAPQLVEGSADRTEDNRDTISQQVDKIQAAVDSAIKTLVGRGFTRDETYSLISSIRIPYDERYAALQEEYYLLRNQYYLLEEQLNLGRKLAPQELIITKTLAGDDSRVSGTVLAPSYITETRLDRSAFNLDRGFQNELETLREDNLNLKVERADLQKQIEALSGDRERYQAVETQVQMLAIEVENYKSLLQTKESYAQQMEELTKERDRLVEALQKANERREQADQSTSTDTPLDTAAATDELIELTRTNQQLQEENAALLTELNRVRAEERDRLQDGGGPLQHTDRRVRLDVSSITADNNSLEVTSKPANVASTLEVTQNRKPQGLMPVDTTGVGAGTASEFRRTNFFEELVDEAAQPTEIRIQQVPHTAHEDVTLDANFQVKPPGLNVSVTTSSSVSPASHAFVEYGVSKSVSPNYRPIAVAAPRDPGSSDTARYGDGSKFLPSQLDSKVRLSETQADEFAQQLANLETEKLDALRAMEQLQTVYAELRNEHDALLEAHEELAQRYAVQQNRNNQLEEEHNKMRGLFSVDSPARHISSIDISQSSHQERAPHPMRHLVQVRESDLNVGDLTSSGHHMTEAERYIKDPPSASAQSFSELPDGHDRAEKVKAVLVWKEKCSQLESRINYVMRDVDNLKSEKEDLEEKLAAAEEQNMKLKAANQELSDELERLQRRLSDSMLEAQLYRTTNNGFGKQLKQLLNESVRMTQGGEPSIAAPPSTDTTFLVEEARGLVESGSGDPPSKVFTEDDVNAMLDALKEELLNLRSEADQHQEAATLFANEIESLQGKVEGLTGKIAEKTAEADQYREEIQRLSATVEADDRELARLREEIASREEQVQRLSSAMDSHSAGLAAVQSSEAALRGEVAALFAERNQLSAENRRLARQVDELAGLNAAVTAELSGAQTAKDMVHPDSLEVGVLTDTSGLVDRIVQSSTIAPAETRNAETQVVADPVIEEIAEQSAADKETIDKLQAQMQGLTTELISLHRQLDEARAFEGSCTILRQESHQLREANRALEAKLAGHDAMCRRLNELETASKHQQPVQNMLHRKVACGVDRSTMAAPTTPLLAERGTQSMEWVVFTAAAQTDPEVRSIVDTLRSTLPVADHKSRAALPTTSVVSSAVTSFLGSIAETNRIMGIELATDVPVRDLENSTVALANLITQHTELMERRLGEYAALMQQRPSQEQPVQASAPTVLPTHLPGPPPATPQQSLAPDIVLRLQQELQHISDHIRANNESISTVVRTTEFAFTKLREAMASQSPRESPQSHTQHEHRTATDTGPYAELLAALLESIIKLNTRLDSMDGDRASFVAELAIYLGLPCSATEEGLKRHLKDILAERTSVVTANPAVLIENIAELKRNISEADAQLHLLEENALEQVRAASAPQGISAFTVLSPGSGDRPTQDAVRDKNMCLSGGASLSMQHGAKDVALLESELRQRNQEIRELRERLARNTEAGLQEPNTVEHILHAGLSHGLRSVQSSTSHRSLQSIVDVTNGCNDARQKYLEERIAILETENESFKSFNATYVTQLAEQTEEIAKLRNQNHQLSLKLVEQNSFKEQIQLAENTRQGITEQIRNVRSTLVEIKTYIQSDKSDGELSEAAAARESKGIEAVEEKLIEVTEDACNWRLKYEKANAQRKEMRARARTECMLRAKVEKAHKKLETNFAHLQAQLKEGNASLKWLKAATMRYIEAVQQELDRLNSMGEARPGTAY